MLAHTLGHVLNLAPGPFCLSYALINLPVLFEIMEKLIDVNRVDHAKGRVLSYQSYPISNVEFNAFIVILTVLMSIFVDFSK